MTMNLELKAIEEIIRSAYEQEKKANESINTLPPVEHTMTILATRQLYNEIEKMRGEHKTITQ
jgi:hypothetical protein